MLKCGNIPQPPMSQWEPVQIQSRKQGSQTWTRLAARKFPAQAFEQRPDVGFDQGDGLAGRRIFDVVDVPELDAVEYRRKSPDQERPVLGLFEGDGDRGAPNVALRHVAWNAVPSGQRHAAGAQRGDRVRRDRSAVVVPAVWPQTRRVRREGEPCIDDQMIEQQLRETTSIVVAATQEQNGCRVGQSPESYAKTRTGVGDFTSREPRDTALSFRVWNFIADD